MQMPITIAARNLGRMKSSAVPFITNLCVYTFFGNLDTNSKMLRDRFRENMYRDLYVYYGYIS